MAVLVTNIFNSRKSVSSIKNPDLVEKNKTFDSPSSHYVSVRINSQEIYSGILSEKVQNQLVFWQGYAFKADNQFGSNSKLIKYDLHTGEKTPVLNTTEVDNEWIGVTSMEIVKNKLVVVLSAYMQYSRVFWFSSPDSTASEIQGQTSSTSVEKIDGHYYLTGGFGDGCGSITHYNLLDPDTLTTEHIISSYNGCTEGEMVLGTYNSDFLVSKHKSNNKNYPESQNYQNLETVSMIDPNERTMLLSTQEMPKNVWALNYAKNSNSVWIFGGKLYKYDLLTEQLSLVANIPSVLTSNRTAYINGSSVCIVQSRKGENGLYRQYYYVLDNEDNLFVEDQFKCARKNTSQKTTEQISEELKNYYQSLSLPASVSVYVDEKKIY
jgi:hypothetical protein